jgi:hypothetical protein
LPKYKIAFFNPFSSKLSTVHASLRSALRLSTGGDALCPKRLGNGRRGRICLQIKCAVGNAGLYGFVWSVDSELLLAIDGNRMNAIGNVIGINREVKIAVALDPNEFRFFALANEFREFEWNWGIALGLERLCTSSTFSRSRLCEAPNAIIRSFT